MAQTVHLFLEIEGNEVQGESTVSSLDRDDTIECFSFEYGGTVQVVTGGRRGRQAHEPVTVVKRIDKSTPLLIKAMCDGERVTRAEFRCYRPDSTASGDEEHFYTVIVEGGLVTGVNQVSEDTSIGGADAPPMLEEITFSAERITWRYEATGAEHVDSVR